MQNSATDSKNLPQAGTALSQDRLSIGKAAKHIGVSIDTLRRWEKKGVVKALRSPGGHRYFLKKDLENLFVSSEANFLEPKAGLATTNLRISFLNLCFLILSCACNEAIFCLSCS